MIFIFIKRTARLCLFIPCLDVLSKLLYKAGNDRQIKGIQLSRGGLPIPHLLFADDLFITIRAKHYEIASCKNILDKFCQWSGQQINVNKSGIHFSRNIRAEGRREIKSTLGKRKLKQNAKYLGNQAFSHREKKNRSF